MQLLKVREVTKRLSCSLSTAYALIESGQLTKICVGADGKGIRVAEDELEAFIRRRTSEPKQEEPEVKLPKATSRVFKNLDGGRLREAWRKQGVLAARPGECNAPSSESSCDPSVGPAS